MENFITSYGLPFHDFQELLKKTGAVVAGSAALALYLQQESIDAGFIPNDMDIFVHRPCPCDQCNPLVQFVRLHGFKKTGKFDCITIAAENARLEKALAASQKEAKALEGRLTNPAFAEKAKPEAVEKARADHAHHSAEALRLAAALERLG